MRHCVSLEVQHLRQATADSQLLQNRRTAGSCLRLRSPMKAWALEVGSTMIVYVTMLTTYCSCKSPAASVPQNAARSLTTTAPAAAAVWQFRAAAPITKQSWLAPSQISKLLLVAHTCTCHGFWNFLYLLSPLVIQCRSVIHAFCTV